MHARLPRFRLFERMTKSKSLSPNSCATRAPRVLSTTMVIFAPYRKYRMPFLRQDPARYETVADLSSRTKADVDIRQLERELVAANAKITALELSHASKVESLSGELEAAKDKISKLEESNASKTSLNVELYRQVQHQRNVSSMLASDLELETWKAKIYKDGTQHAHDYAEAKFEDKITDLEQEASRMISKIEEEADRAVSEAQQKTEVAQSEVEHARKEVEHAKEAIEYAVNEAKSAEQAARASKRLADKRGANVFNVVHSNMHLIGFLEDVKEDLKGRKSDLLAENLRLIESEGRDLVNDMDPELKQKWKAMHS